MATKASTSRRAKVGPGSPTKRGASAAGAGDRASGVGRQGQGKAPAVPGTPGARPPVPPVGSPAPAAQAPRPVAQAAPPEQSGGQAQPHIRQGPALVPARWVPLTTTILSVLGVADASYLTYLHFTNKLPLVCPTKGGFVDCEAVLDSRYSHPFGIPVVVPGLVWAVVMLALCTPWAWRAVSPWVYRARLAGVAAGMVTVFYLLWAELIKLQHLCEYCTGIHIVTVCLFFVVVFGTALAVPAGADEDEADQGA